MTDLTTATTPVRTGPDSFRAEVPDGWQQGRGAFGGVVVGNLVRAIVAFDEADAPSPGRPLRALTAELCGPVLPGAHTIRVERLRTGTGVSTVAARLERDGEVLAHAVGVLGRSRAEDSDFCELRPPAMPPWRDVPVVSVEPSIAPTFARLFEFRPLGGPPYQGGPEAVAAGWIRARDPGPTRDAGYVATLADAWWPAIFNRLTAPRPVATVVFTLELIDSLEGLDPAAPFFHSARALVARGGYMVEMRELRGEDGRLVALNQQTFTVIK